MWAATEMKFKRQATAMRKRNLELTEKLKEVRRDEGSWLWVVDGLDPMMVLLSMQIVCDFDALTACNIHFPSC